jgi:hypothetical protein
MSNVTDINEAVSISRRLIHIAAMALAALEDATAAPPERIERARHFLTMVVPSECNERSTAD